VSPAALQSNTLPPAQGGLVLVVDDEPGIREALTEILEHAGYRVDVARSGVEAWERLQANDYAAVLSDIRMPQMTGLELYWRLKAAKPRQAARFIIVTGDDLGGSVRDFLRETSVPCISKPFVPRDVRTLVAATVHSSR
jgi:CheY-like chemotaxis protein